MNSSIQPDYTALDRPEILNFLFHPRRDFSMSTSGGNSKKFNFNVDDNVTIGAKLHTADPRAPVIIFFHGNGEIVSDYDDLAPMFTKSGINFFAFDYRGYGDSTGTPTVSAMMKDCHVLFKNAKTWLADNNYTGPVIVMGRSLGSASALELAAHYTDDIDALIIESGFAHILPLLELLGGFTPPGIREENGPMNYEKIMRFNKPTLVIHAEYDHIIPYSEGETLYKNSPAENKQMLQIKGADHNSIFYHGLNDYMDAVVTLIRNTN